MKPMKTTLTVIVCSTIGIAWWQGRELARLKQRESELKHLTEVSRKPHATTRAAPEDRSSAPTLDAKSFVEMLGSWLEKGVPPTQDEREFLRKQIEAASGRDLKQWALALRESGLPGEMKSGFLSAIVPRIAESDPRLAAELVLTGDDGDSFRSVLRTWLASDAKAASAWLQKIEAPTFRNARDMDFPALLSAAEIAANPESGEVLLEMNANQARKTLEELSRFQAPADLSKVLRLISSVSNLPENERMQLVGGVLATHRDPAMARQILLDANLPANQFVKAASILIQSLDPVAKSASIAWVKSLPDPEQRETLLRILENGSSAPR